MAQSTKQTEQKKTETHTEKKTEKKTPSRRSTFSLGSLVNVLAFFALAAAAVLLVIGPILKAVLEATGGGVIMQALTLVSQYCLLAAIAIPGWFFVRGKRKGWKQRQLAEIIDVTDEYISHVENAHVRPSLDKAVAIANALGIDMNTLLEDSLSGARREILNQRLNELTEGMEPDKLALVADFCRTLENYEIEKQQRGDAD